jgi:hypothetical protein
MGKSDGFQVRKNVEIIAEVKTAANFVEAISQEPKVEVEEIQVEESLEEKLEEVTSPNPRYSVKLSR